ncbi:hypothetical protein NLI96_g12100 [Meripilus lineatus]|uniref:Uncharacterized protein n=1 Tax=Meripilus lineatus TaxID=2056292 RepID=A0AAD5UQH8_9APHY|nr:hypothetical protein NLI96_g12100 [Physisporinus lineatus]
MKAIYLEFSDTIEKASDAKGGVVSSLMAYVQFCPNLHTLRLEFWDSTLWVLRQLPDVLSSLVSLRRIALQFWEKVDVVLLDANEGTWAAVDKDLGDDAKFGSLEYVEVQCTLGEDEEAQDWWENDTGSREDGQRDSGRESDGGGGETERLESLRGEKGKQRQQGIAPEVESGSNGDMDLPRKLRATMNGIAYFHCHKKPLTAVFPCLCARGILWCGSSHYDFVLHISTSNLKGMKSPTWRSPYCRSLFQQDIDYN